MGLLILLLLLLSPFRKVLRCFMILYFNKGYSLIRHTVDFPFWKKKQTHSFLHFYSVSHFNFDSWTGRCECVCKQVCHLGETD